MKTKTLLLLPALFIMISALGQKYTFNLTFNAVDDTNNVKLDSILIRNLTQTDEIMLYWPDKTLELECIPEGLQEHNPEADGLQVFQNYPNPVTNQTTITLSVPENDEVGIMITDIMGRVVQKSEWLLEKGYHSFKYVPGESGIYAFNAFWRKSSGGIKIISQGNGSSSISLLEYSGRLTDDPAIKKLNVQSFSYNCNDELLYIGYAQTTSGLRGSDVIEDAPVYDSTYIFDILSGIPCQDVPLVEINWVDYKTVQIGTQCWLKENLDRGTMILGINEQTDNGTIEKYCFDDDPANCDIYGGLYQGKEAMKYSDEEGVQGICPSGWHIPTDEEWKQLEGEADSQFDYPDPEWNKLDYRGFDVGRRLKTQTGWNVNNGMDYVGFSWLPSGTRRFDGVFLNMGSYSGIWSSSAGGPNGNWYRFTEGYISQTSRTFNSNAMGRPVRCIKDE